MVLVILVCIRTTFQVIRDTRSVERVEAECPVQSLVLTSGLALHCCAMCHSLRSRSLGHLGVTSHTARGGGCKLRQYSC